MCVRGILSGGPESQESSGLLVRHLTSKERGGGIFTCDILSSRGGRAELALHRDTRERTVVGAIPGEGGAEGPASAVSDFQRQALCDLSRAAAVIRSPNGASVEHKQKAPLLTMDSQAPSLGGGQPKKSPAYQKGARNDRSAEQTQVRPLYYKDRAYQHNEQARGTRIYLLSAAAFARGLCCAMCGFFSPRRLLHGASSSLSAASFHGGF